ncbi:ANTAR domain-containing protein [Rhodococcus sp. 077-4]|uniref:ANTAR domain-containing protein n=1 Tax=Rhodococcus sp. 077-4 TaxID=2789271 RepID=UPI0039F5B104
MDTVQVLRAGVPDAVQQALDNRAPIEQAKGILMAEHRIGPEAAFDMLAEQSQRSNRKLREVALDHIRQVSAG